MWKVQDNQFNISLFSISRATGSFRSGLGRTEDHIFIRRVPNRSNGESRSSCKHKLYLQCSSFWVTAARPPFPPSY